MGVVYRAHHQLLRRPTAVKLISGPHYTERRAARFEQEVRQTARLTHPNTVTVFDYGRTHDGVFYYAMELLDGATLEEVVATGGALPDARVLHVLDGVLGALAEAHAANLIHRDIKPSNIMLCEQGGEADTPKVLDFGLVKDLQTDASLTQEGALAGSPAFMSPEAIRAPDRVGPASDLYSLGAVAYHLLTARHVFEGTTALEVCSHHLVTQPEPPSARRGRPLSAGLERLVLACLSKDPEQRPKSALELRRRLRELPGIARWSGDDARAWWDAHRDELARRRRASVTDVSRTLAVELSGRS
jgi:serine/threonine-protein kinase